MTAYLDGELDAAARSALESALETDASLQQRLASLHVHTGDIKCAFDQLLDQAPDMPARTAINLEPSCTEVPWYRGWQTLVAACALAAITSAVATFSLTRSLTDWMDYVAAYQALYSHDTLKHVSATLELASAELTRVSAAVGQPLSLHLVSALPGVEYKRAQLLGYQGAPLAQLTFVTEDGTPLALCILESDASDDTISITTLEGLQAARWVSDGQAFLLIGGAEEALVRTIASEFVANS